MIYVTGDTHGDMSWVKLNTAHFPQQKEMTKNDYLIICGDFGGIWDGSKTDDYILDTYEKRKFTTLFIDGNHENFNLLNAYPVTEWNGGKVHVIRPSVIHLMRGQVYTINGKKIFTFGGAESIDKWHRTEGISWWPQEVPSFEEFKEAEENLIKNDLKVDYIITHAAPYGIGFVDYDPVTAMLKDIRTNVSFKKWYCGHYHRDYDEFGIFRFLFNDIVRLGE